MQENAKNKKKTEHFFPSAVLYGLCLPYVRRRKQVIGVSHTAERQTGHGGCSHHSSSKSYGKNGSRIGSDATQSSGFHILQMPLAQHKTHLRPWRQKTVCWPYFFPRSEALWFSSVHVWTQNHRSTYIIPFFLLLLRNVIEHNSEF